MRKLSRKEINSMLKEEIEAIIARKIFEQCKPKIRNIRTNMILEGSDPRRVDENIYSMLTGAGQRLAGLGLSDFVPVGDTENLFGDMSSGIRIAIEQSILETLVKKIGLDPYSGFGLTLKNAFEQVLKKYNAGELKDMMSSSGDCRSTATEIAKEVLQIIEETEKERILGVAIKAVLGELGADFQTSKFTKPIYQNVREKFSEAFDEVFDEEAIAADLAKMICDNFTLDNALSSAGEYIKSSAGSAFEEFASAFDGLKNKFIE